jgi:hypothetical protein
MREELPEFAKRLEENCLLRFDNCATEIHWISQNVMDLEQSHSLGLERGSTLLKSPTIGIHPTGATFIRAKYFLGNASRYLWRHFLASSFKKLFKQSLKYNLSELNTRWSLFSTR